MSNYSGVFIPEALNNPWNEAFDLINEKSLVLDVGCSSGNFGEALIKHKNCIVDGVEPDKNDSRKAARKLRKVSNKFVEDALKTEFKKEKYDAIVFLDVIEHLYNPASTLRSLKKNLKPNGMIVFSIPNMAHISVRLMLLKGDFEYANTGLLDNTHLHFYTKKEIERLFSEAGFTINVLNHTEAIYSDDQITDELGKLGIKYNNKLAKILRDDSAHIFQFVGTAVMSTPKKVERKLLNPDPQSSISKWYEDRLIKQTNKINNLSNEIEYLKTIVNSQNDTLSNDKELASMVRLSKYLKYYFIRKINNSKNK